MSWTHCKEWFKQVVGVETVAYVWPLNPELDSIFLEDRIRIRFFLYDQIRIPAFVTLESGATLSVAPRFLAMKNVQFM